MVKLLLLMLVLYIAYKIFFKKTPATKQDENELVECYNCHTYVPISECKLTNRGYLCKDCQ
ncbi:MAG: glucose-inhibited division protein B [Epsilonproteobacteria bacterium]|nr:glucose-inhibited division protein B [Campylobacterota bacterium]